MDSRVLKPGDWVSRISYMEVLTNTPEYLEVRNEVGHEWQVGHTILDKEKCQSASVFGITQKLNLTDTVDLIRTAGDSVLTINFNKQVKPEDVREAIMSLYANSGGKIISKDQFTAKAKEVEAKVKLGEERTMICRLSNAPDKFGRFQVIDLQCKYDPKPNKTTGELYDNRWRQINQLTINWVILRGIKTIVD